MNIVEPEIERYVDALRGEVDPVVAEMERMARQRGFPIVGPQVGALLYLLARSSGARTILELGSGFGYSAYWFARALPPEAGSGALVHCTDTSAENRDLALGFLDRLGLARLVRFHVGDALQLAGTLSPPFDIVFNDVDKEQYPATVERAVALLRPGGLFITDNVLWKGRVVDAAGADETTRAVQRFNELITHHDELETVILPLRDGLAICRKR
jgi:predicted O-methyltransferase YrrM